MVTILQKSKPPEHRRQHLTDTLNTHPSGFFNRESALEGDVGGDPVTEGFE
jgi:hypothetical protein